MSCRKLVFDTGPLGSFAVVAQLGLLEVVCAGHGSLGQRHNRGEAEAIFLARRLGGVFVSEDRDARVLAAGELGANRVVGTPLLPAGSAWGWSGPSAPGRSIGRCRPPGDGRATSSRTGSADEADTQTAPRWGGAVWTTGPPLGGGRSRGSKG
jgi:hypothetical protein